MFEGKIQVFNLPVKIQLKIVKTLKFLEEKCLSKGSLRPDIIEPK